MNMTDMQEPAWIWTNSHITIVFEDGQDVTIYASDPRWQDVTEAVKEQDWEWARKVALPSEQLQEQFENLQLTERVSIDAGVVKFNDRELHTTLTDRMLEMAEQGIDITPMARFLDNLMENPSHRAVVELYDFLEATKLPITDDGHFLAYKRVRDDYTDIYSGKFDNSIGQVCSMPRNMVDDERERTCSNGLHFCGRGYLTSYGTGPGHRTMVVKVNPRDVVSVPSDHNNMKARACQYKIVGELNHSAEDPLESPYRSDFDDRQEIDERDDNDDERVYDDLDDAFDILERLERESSDRFDDLNDDLDDDEGPVSLDDYPETVIKYEDYPILKTRAGITNTSNLSLGEYNRRYPFAVVDVEHNVVYPNARIAATAKPGAHPSNIRAVCRGERMRAGDIRWQYFRDWLRERVDEAVIEEEERQKSEDFTSGLGFPFF